jgi:hypothetical protein
MRPVELTSRVPVYPKVTQAKPSVQNRVLALQERAQKLQIEAGPNRPDTRSPLDPWHEEAYLIACLVRMHGWSQTEPGELLNLKRRLAK